MHIVKVIPIPSMLLVLLLACTSGKDKAQHDQEHVEYTCSMHPQIIQDKPGDCPICGMKLVKKHSAVEVVHITQDLKDLAKPTNASVIDSMETIHPERKSMSIRVTAPGVIGYDTRKAYNIPIRFDGRIEKLYLKYNYQPVKKGQVIMEVYSPELVTAQRELIYVAKEQKEDRPLFEAAQQKLLLLGMTPKQIENVLSTGKEIIAIPVVSPYAGYIVEANATGFVGNSANSSQPSMDNVGMDKVQGALPIPSRSNMESQLSIREGMYLTKGQNLFKVVDATRFWAELYFSVSDGSQIRIGDKLHIRVKGMEDSLVARIDFIQPYFNEGEQFILARSYVKGKHLHVGQLVFSQLTQTKTSLWVPQPAVLDLGVQRIVLLKNKGTFTPYKVKTGLVTDGWIEIVGGLDESNEVAVNAQYMIDSDSFIKVINP